MAHFPLLHLTSRHPSATLLLVQLTGMLLYPFLEGTQVGVVARLIGLTMQSHRDDA